MDNNLNKEKEAEKNIILGNISKIQENIKKQENSITKVYYNKNDRKELLKMRIDKGMKMCHIDDRKKIIEKNTKNKARNLLKNYLNYKNGLKFYIVPNKHNKLRNKKNSKNRKSETKELKKMKIKIQKVKKLNSKKNSASI